MLIIAVIISRIIILVTIAKIIPTNFYTFLHKHNSTATI